MKEILTGLRDFKGKASAAVANKAFSIKPPDIDVAKYNKNLIQIGVCNL